MFQFIVQHFVDLSLALFILQSTVSYITCYTCTCTWVLKIINSHMQVVCMLHIVLAYIFHSLVPNPSMCKAWEWGYWWLCWTFVLNNPSPVQIQWNLSIKAILIIDRFLIKSHMYNEADLRPCDFSCRGILRVLWYYAILKPSTCTFLFWDVYLFLASLKSKIPQKKKV